MAKRCSTVPAAAALLLVLAGCGAAGEGAATPSGSAAGVSFAVGECVRFGGGEEFSIDSAECGAAHQGQVVLSSAGFFTEDALPEPDRLVAIADTACQQAMSEFVGDAAGVPLRSSYTYPTEQTWAAGDRHLTCFAVAFDESTGEAITITGPLREPSQN